METIYCWPARTSRNESIILGNSLERVALGGCYSEVSLSELAACHLEIADMMGLNDFEVLEKGKEPEPEPEFEDRQVRSRRALSRGMKSEPTQQTLSAVVRTGVECSARTESRPRDLFTIFACQNISRSPPHQDTIQSRISAFVSHES